MTVALNILRGNKGKSTEKNGYVTIERGKHLNLIFPLGIRVFLFIIQNHFFYGNLIYF